MKYQKLNKQGMTLIELLVTAVIVSIVSVILVAFLGDWVEQHAVSDTRTQLLTEAQNSLDIITDAVRLSAAADQLNRWEDPNSPGAPDDVYSWSSDSDTLVLASAVEDTNGDIVFSDTLSYTSQKNNQIFFVSDSKLYRRLLAAPEENNTMVTSCPESISSDVCPKDRLLADNVTSFVIKYYNADNQEVSPVGARSIQVSLTLAKTTYKQPIEESYSTRMVFRND